MYEKIGLFQIAGSMARHAAARQSTIARNVANADTPGYVAQDLRPFRESYRAEAPALRETRAGHLHMADSATTEFRLSSDTSAMSPNGNAVSLETEMVRAVDAKRQHDLALTIYKTSMGILRSSLGRR